MLNAGKPINESRVLMFPTIIIVLLLISLFMFVNICFMYLAAPGFSIYLQLLYLLVGLIPLLLCNVLLCLLLQSLDFA